MSLDKDRSRRQKSNGIVVRYQLAPGLGWDWKPGWVVQSRHWGEREVGRMLEPESDPNFGPGLFERQEQLLPPQLSAWHPENMKMKILIFFSFHLILSLPSHSITMDPPAFRTNTTSLFTWTKDCLRQKKKQGWRSFKIEVIKQWKYLLKFWNCSTWKDQWLKHSKQAFFFFWGGGGARVQSQLQYRVTSFQYYYTAAKVRKME